MGAYSFDASWSEERRRLAAIEEWADPHTTRRLAELGVAPGWRCLEAGGGGGSIARWMCDAVGETGRVVATDLDTRFLEEISSPAIEVRHHDVTSDDIEEDAFDLVHARLLLEHLAERDGVLKRFAAALKPGGWLLIEDYDWATGTTSIPESETYTRVVEATIRIMSAGAYDPLLGRRLPKMLEAAGLREIGAEGVVGYLTPDSPGRVLWRLSLMRLRDGIAGSGLASEAELDQVLGLLDDPAFATLSPIMMQVWGRR